MSRPTAEFQGASARSGFGDQLEAEAARRAAANPLSSRTWQASAMILDEPALAALVAAHEPADRFGPESERPLLAIRLDRGAEPLAAFVRRLPCVVVGVGPAGSALADACDVRLDSEDALPTIARTVAGAPLAATVLVQLLRASETLKAEDALVCESFAYATVQRGRDFMRWHNSMSPQPRATNAVAPLRVSRRGAVLDLRLDDPANRNAIGSAMRDALCEAFDLALADDGVERVQLSGAGRCFSVGGDVAEFGQVEDAASAHWIRTLRAPATRASRLRGRLEARIDGAAIGAGIELAAFADRLIATPRSWFQMPELAYGLLPGAGGTVSLPRRIGRQRTALLALTMQRLPASTALAWGLIDALA